MQCCAKVWKNICDSSKERKMNTTIWTAAMRTEEAAAKLLASVREIRALDAQYEKMMRDKATIYRTAKKSGLNKAAIKAIVNDPSANDDVKILRRYLDLIAGPEAASAMRDADHFGTILFGANDSWPTDYSDPKHGLANTP
jgi:uncharacterized protein (UPF0335 family)